MLIYLISSEHCARVATCSEGYFEKNAAVCRAIWLVGGLPRQACMTIACALHSGKAARQRLNAARLVELPFSLDFYSSTGVILLPTRSGQRLILRFATASLLAAV